MALMAAHGEITPTPDAAIFADTQGEPAGVYVWLDWLENHLPFPLHRVTAGSLADAATDMKMTKDGRKFSRTAIPVFTRNANGKQGKIPYRACTADFKIKPIIMEVNAIIGSPALKEWRQYHCEDLRELARYEKACKEARKTNASYPKYPDAAWDNCQRDALATQWIGISTDEATRMKISRTPWIKNRWPLIELSMRRSDCLEWMNLNEYPEPPRSACVYCPFHNNHEWRRLKNDEPEAFQQAVEFEIRLQKAKENSDNFTTVPYLHRSLVSLESVDFSTAEDRGQLNLFENECEGMCGV